MTIGEKIKKARLQKGLSVRELAKECGWESSHSRIVNYETGLREPGIKDVKRIASVLEYPIEWFYSEDNIGSPIKSIPVLSMESLRGYLEGSLKEDNLEFVDFYKPNVFGVRVKGNSMSAQSGITFIENSIILIDPFLKPSSEDFVIATIDDGPPIFRQIILEGNERYLKALNTSWKIINLSDNTNIIGVVVSTIFQFK